MHLHEFLRGLHERLRPRSYLEIGVHAGLSLAASRTRSIGVDPTLQISVEISCDLQLVKATSDDFFARPDPLAWFPKRTPDLTFIDGMHLFEFVLRDFINTERHCEPTGVIVLDDMLPRTDAEASRLGNPEAWTGDVFKLGAVLERCRPDLTIVRVDTAPTGVLIALRPDRENRFLTESYQQLTTDEVHNDPQRVPTEILQRRDAADPTSVLSSAVWDDILIARHFSRAPSAAALASLAELCVAAH